jgi:acetyl esterase/lipase
MTMPTTPLIAGLSLLGMLALAALPQAAQAAPPPASQPLRLWEGDAPDAKGALPADIPTLTVYAPAPEKSNGAAVVVCPGGGYGGLADHEGKPIAEWLNTIGVTGIVLKYRLGPKYHHPVEMGDVARAIRTVRSHATDWGIDPHRVGVLGFSAGGHLASTAATHFDAGNAGAPDPIDRLSSRPDVAILIYPVITFTDPSTHGGSRHNLLGDNPSPDLITLLSNEKQVTAQTPPCFLVHGTDDAVVPAENSLMFALACRKAGVPVELHLYEHGPHGFGLGGGDPVLSAWPGSCAKWLEHRGFLKKLN